MPKFLDTPEWYDRYGNAVKGYLGTSNVSDGQVLTCGYGEPKWTDKDQLSVGKAVGLESHTLAEYLQTMAEAFNGIAFDSGTITGSGANLQSFTNDSSSSCTLGLFTTGAAMVTDLSVLQNGIPVQGCYINSVSYLNNHFIVSVYNPDGWGSAFGYQVLCHIDIKLNLSAFS